jgi:hypothetical protein
MRPVRSAVSLAAALAAAAVAAQQPAAPAAQEEHVRGVIASVSGDTLTVKGRDGRARTLTLQEKTRVSLASKASLDAVKQGGYVGVTAVEQPGGTLRAVEVHVFPESARGAGEGHRPWDLKPGSSMTNAMVSGVEASKGKGSAGSSMTNATVSGAQGAAGGGKRLELTYKDGKKTVEVPPSAPVVALEPADRSALKPGQHVFAAGARQPDGAVAVDRMVAGKDGVVPPM